MPTARPHLVKSLSRTAIAGAVWFAAWGLGLQGCSDPSGLAAPPLTATVVTATDNQAGLVGTALPLPLKVKVDSAGVPKAGVRIIWHTTAGSVTPTQSVSDGDGFASAAWTLGTVAGAIGADATIAGAQASSVHFKARAVPGPAVAITTVSGEGQTFPANLPAAPLVALVADDYGNTVEGQAVTWTIRSGPVAFLTTGGATDAVGHSIVSVAPTGTPGKAVVRAALPGIAASADFTLTIEAPTFVVVLHTTSGPISFISSQNHSTNPAVDTIPVGRSMTWTLEFDYGDHGVASVGTPSFQGRDFDYFGPTILSVLFTAPGTYHYADPYNPGATGIVVVK